MDSEDINSLFSPFNITENSSLGTEPKTGLPFFVDYINELEGAKTKIKNLHWAAKTLPVSDKRGTHLYLDDFLGIVGDFQDTVAESSQGILGEMSAASIKGKDLPCVTPKELIRYLLEVTVAFYNSMPAETVYVGIKSETEVFIKDLTKYKYLFRLAE